jgi:hypothetical protein
MFRLLTIVLVCVLVFLSAVQADDRVGSFIVFDDVQDAIFLDGEITISTPLDMRRAMSLRPQAKVIVLASPGGLVASALIVADDVHRLGISTFIPEGMGCYSACAFVFLAGQTRVAAGELGVHQMASEIPDPSGVQYSTADILDALATFDVPSEVIARMLRTPNDSMYVFTATEIEALGINRSGDVADLHDAPRTPAPVSPEPLTSATGTKLALYQGLDFYGGDLSAFRTPDAVQCATACMEDRMCRAFTYNANPNLKKGPNCFLKSGTDRPVAYDDAISGVLLHGDATATDFEVGFIDVSDVTSGLDLPGGDMQSRPLNGVRSIDACRAACVGDTMCKGFSFVIRQKQCWLKQDVGVTSTDRNVASAVKRYITYGAEKLIALD